MPTQNFHWQLPVTVHPPEGFIETVKRFAPDLDGHYIAQLLWHRGICAVEQVAGFLDPHQYQPASPFDFGSEMTAAVERLQQAQSRQERVAIWGDFDADGITATAVLWEGLGKIFEQNCQLVYWIPNRLQESHGLSVAGIEALAAQNCRLIVTCDTGSTNLPEIEVAHSLGMDVIVTDHHTLPTTRPPVTAIINPRYLPSDHPLAHLSGVAVAYKLVEALYQACAIPQTDLETLLDLVAIGLIADLVQLTGDCRYLAQKGIEHLQKHLQRRPTEQTRPGVAQLLELCKRSGDRPTDISFGLGPRINAVSRIQGDARFCVELLTSRDPKKCRHLAEATELANTRRKALQKEVAQQARDKVEQLDLSTTSVIVLVDPQWPVGVLGLVAGQIAQEYGRPTLLLQSDLAAHPDQPALARGSARSVNQIDLYQVVQEQAHLLHSFGGHPFAAGLSLEVDNVPLFTEAINQKLRQQQFTDLSQGAILPVDLVVTVAELGPDLFRELKLLEPCGMGNPVPKLLIQNCWFEQVWHRNIKDWKGRKVSYIKTEFELWDDSSPMGFPGVWWEHYKEDVPTGRCDAIAELDFNTYNKRYELRLLDVRPCTEALPLTSTPKTADWIWDWRHHPPTPAPTPNPQPLTPTPQPLLLTPCPLSWEGFHAWFRRALQEERPLAIAYPPPTATPPYEIWQQLVGIAKYLSRTGQVATRYQWSEKLQIGDRTLQVGFRALKFLGFTLTARDRGFQCMWQPPEPTPELEHQQTEAIQAFLAAIQEEQFRRQYFYQVPLSTIQMMALNV